MDLDIIARLVQILKDAPELGAIEVRRGLFGAWSSIRVTKAGRASNAGGPHFATGPVPGADRPRPRSRRAPNGSLLLVTESQFGPSAAGEHVMHRRAGGPFLDDLPVLT